MVRELAQKEKKDFLPDTDDMILSLVSNVVAKALNCIVTIPCEERGVDPKPFITVVNRAIKPDGVRVGYKYVTRANVVEILNQSAEYRPDLKGWYASDIRKPYNAVMFGCGFTAIERVIPVFRKHGLITRIEVTPKGTGFEWVNPPPGKGFIPFCMPMFRKVLAEVMDK